RSRVCRVKPQASGNARGDWIGDRRDSSSARDDYRVGAARLSSDPGLDAYVYAAAFMEEMGRAGVRHVCISPGSRSAPLALAAANEPHLEAWVHIDERCGGFFALGLPRALEEPVAIVCTSGTAAANFYPAIV